MAVSRVGHPSWLRIALPRDSQGRFRTPNVVFTEALGPTQTTMPTEEHAGPVEETDDPELMCEQGLTPLCTPNATDDEADGNETENDGA